MPKPTYYGADPLTGGYQCTGCQCHCTGKPAATWQGRAFCSKECKAACMQRRREMLKPTGKRTRTKNLVIKSVQEWKDYCAKQAKQRHKNQKPDKRIPTVRNVSPKRRGLLAWLFGR